MDRPLPASVAPPTPAVLPSTAQPSQTVPPPHATFGQAASPQNPLSIDGNRPQGAHEEALREREERLRIALEAARMGTWEYDFATNDSHVSAFTASLFGMSGGEQRAKQDFWFSLFHPQDREAMSRAAAHAKRTGEDFKADYRIIRPDGQLRWMRSCGGLVCDALGQPLRIVGVVSDITDEHLADEALRDSERKLRLALEAGGMGLWDWSQVTDTVGLSQEISHVFGLATATRLSWQAFLALLHDEDRAVVQAARHDGLNEQGSFQVEFRIVRRAGGPRWARVYGRALIDDVTGAVNLIGILCDITETHAAACAALEQSEERLRRALRAANMGMWEWNVAEDRMVWSDDAADMLHLPVDDLPTDRLGAEALLHPDDSNRVLATREHAAQGHAPEDRYEVEFRLAHMAKSPRWFTSKSAIIRDGQGRVERMVGTFLDITNRKQAESALRESEARYRSLVENAPDIIAIVGLNQTIAAINRGLGNFSPEQLVGANFCDYCPVESRDALLLAFNRVISDSSVQAVESGLRNATGESRWYEYRLAPICAAGEVVAVTLICTDITARKEIENLLRRAKLELELRVESRTHDLQATNATLLQEIAERRRVEEALRSERELLQGTLEAHERDRQLVAYEIHDGFLQDVVGAKMHLESLLPRLTLPTDQQNQFSEVTTLLAGAIGEGRRLLSGLRPPIIDEQGVIGALEYLISEHHRAGPMRIAFYPPIRFPRLNPLLEGTIYRIVQEALNNAHRHSQATNAMVALAVHGDVLRLDIVDHGIGFDAASVTHGRYGVLGITQRARLLRGTADLDTAPGRGTRWSIRLPLREESRQ